MPYEEVVTEFKRRKLENGKTKRYVHNTGEFLMRFGVGRERQNIHEIPAGDLEAWLDGQTKSQGWSMSTKRTYKLLFSSLWSVATAKNWATVNIVDRLEPVTVVPQKIKIYMTEETQNIMAAALSTPDTKRVLAPLALGAFGCMRPEEIDSSKAKSEGLPETTYFGWHDIDLKNGLIKVRPEIAKTGDERTIRLQPAAVAWLKLARSLGNPLPPVNERRLVDLCCEIINLQEWIRDGLRKSCATHLRAVYKNDYDVVKDLGNSVRILLKHYAALHIPDEQSLDHWKITPEAVGKYMKTRAWELVLRDAAKASITTPRPSASGNAKSSN
jgi:integrase